MLKATLGGRTTLGVISLSSFHVCHPNDEVDKSTLAEVGIINLTLSCNTSAIFLWLIHSCCRVKPHSVGIPKLRGLWWVDNLVWPRILECWGFYQSKSMKWRLYEPKHMMGRGFLYFLWVKIMMKYIWRLYGVGSGGFLHLLLKGENHYEPKHMKITRFRKGLILTPTP